MEYQPVPAHYSKVMTNQHLTFTVLLWLREFRFSSPEVISRLTDMPMPYSSTLHRFMKRLIDRDLVETFYIRHDPKLGILFRLGKAAPAFLQMHGLPHENTYVNSRLLENCKTAIHDLSVQLAAFREGRLDARRAKPGKELTNLQEPGRRVIEVIGEAQLAEDSRGLPQPDLILRSANRRVAYEYELTRKARSRIYFAFTNHLRAIREGHYSGVCYMFPNARIRDAYEDLYMQPMWPQTSRYSNGRVISHGNPFDPDEIHPRGNARESGRKAIQFTVEVYISPISGRGNS